MAPQPTGISQHVEETECCLLIPLVPQCRKQWYICLSVSNCVIVLLNCVIARIYSDDSFKG